MFSAYNKLSCEYFTMFIVFTMILAF